MVLKRNRGQGNKNRLRLEIPTALGQKAFTHVYKDYLAQSILSETDQDTHK